MTQQLLKVRLRPARRGLNKIAELEGRVDQLEAIIVELLGTITPEAAALMEDQMPTIHALLEDK